MIAVSNTHDDHCMTMPPGAARNDCLAEVRDTEEADFSNLIQYYDKTPIDAGRIAEAGWRKGGKREQLELAIYYYTRAHAYVRVERLFASLTPEQKRDAEGSATFLMRSRRVLAPDRRPRARAGRPAPRGRPVRCGQRDLCRPAVGAGRHGDGQRSARRDAAAEARAEDDPGLWGAYAAGAMRFPRTGAPRCTTCTRSRWARAPIRSGWA